MNGAVIAALNEAETIGGLVKDLRGQGLEVCVIDDGSTDGTGEVAQSVGAHVIRNDTPQGIRDSLMTGWRFAIFRDWDYTVQIDAGGSHNPGEVILTLDADISIGSRFMPASRYIGRGWRAVASRVLAHALNFATHKKITDWTSGYRVFSLKALCELVGNPYLTKMHTWQIEVISAAIDRGMTISEYPITYIAGKSSMKVKTILDTITVYLWIFNR